MTTLSNVRSLPSFSGVRIQYPKHRRLVLNFAASLENKIDHNGLLGALLPPAEFNQIASSQAQQAAAALVSMAGAQTVQIQTFVHHSHPGARPVSNLTAASKPAEHNLYKAALSTWDYDLDRFTKQFEAIQLLKTELLSSLDLVTIAELDDPDYGTQRLTPASILVYLDTKFGTATSADLEANRALLAVPFRLDHDFLEFVQTHRNAHLYADRSRQPISTADQVAMFRHAITHCGVFEKRMYYYFTTHATVLSQDFASFATDMTHEWQSVVLPSRATTTVASFAGAAGSSPPVLSISEQVHMAVAAALKGLATIPAGSPPPAGAPKSSPGARKPLEFVHYCFTHGPLCSHPSKDCKSKAPGHDDNATAANLKDAAFAGRRDKWVPAARRGNNSA